jgi:uncharacterized protein YfeS
MSIKPNDKFAAIKLNELARQQLKLKIMGDLTQDLMVCKIEGWCAKQYIQDLKSMIDDLHKTIVNKL